jgi:hypothetical protein
METKGFDAVELSTKQSLVSNMFVTPSDPAPVVQAKPIVSWKERMISETMMRDTIGVSRSRDFVASKNVVTPSIQNESTVAADPMERKGFDKPSVSWKERVLSEAKSRDSQPLPRPRTKAQSQQSQDSQPPPRTKAQLQPNQWKEKALASSDSLQSNRFWFISGMKKTRTLRKQKEKTTSKRRISWPYWWRERNFDTEVTLTKAQKDQNDKTKRTAGSQERDSYGWNVL